MGMLAAFELYGTGHMGTLLVLAVSAALLIRQCRSHPESAHTKSWLTLLAFCCFAAYPANQAAWESTGGQIQLTAIVPLHLCDVTAFLCGFALVTRRQLVCELSYFWGLAGTVQGLLTPNLPYGFPHPVFLTFFMQHGVVVIAALLLPMGLGWRPREYAWLRAFGWVVAYGMAAIGVNILLDTNFGFLMHKPAGASLLDIMPPWPWYILCLLSLALLIFWLLGLPFRRHPR